MKKITFYDFDLQLSAEKRWGPIVDVYRDYLPKLKGHLDMILNSLGVTITVAKHFYNLTPHNNIKYYDEINYLAKRIGLGTFEALVLQLIYETSSACTSAVIRVQDKEFFIRTMDWPMLFLKDITIGLNIKRGSKLIGKVTTWLGYVGFLTASNVIDNYTISINYRRNVDISIASLVKNLYRTLSMKWPIGYLVRDIIETSHTTSNAIKILENSELITPCYVTFYVPNYKTFIITRDCDKNVNTRTDQLVQANCDWNKTEPNILWSLERVEHVKKTENMLNQIKGDLQSRDILKCLLKHPVINDETIYIHYQYGNEFGTYI